MKRKIALIMCLLTLNSTVYGNEYDDISSSYAYDEIKKFEELGYFENIISDENTLFLPKEEMTRGEIVILLLNAFEIELQNEGEVPFADYDNVKDELKPYVVTSYELGLIEGKQKNDGVYFGFDDLITREEMVTMVGNYFDLTSDYELTFDDNDEIGNWAKPYVSYFYENGIVSGDTQNNFNPKSHITRQEAVILTNNFLEFLFVKEENVNGYVVKKYIGNGSMGYKNSDYANSTFTEIKDIEFDEDGKLFIADTLANKIRSAENDKIQDEAGNAWDTDLAGIPIGGYIDGDLDEVLLNRPEKLLVLDDGLVVFTEKNYNSIRVYSEEEGEVATLAGDTEAGYVNGNSEKARFNKPTGIAEDSNGNIYVADTLNHVIRKIDTNGNVTLFAGTPESYGDELGDVLSAKFNEPFDIFIDEKDVMYVSDAGNNSIKKIENGQVTLLAGDDTEFSSDTETEIGGDLDGVAELSQFSYPKSIFVVDDVVYVADTYNNKIKKIEDGFVTTLAGTGETGNIIGKALESTFNYPMSIEVKDNKIYIADTENHMIKILELN